MTEPPGKEPDIPARTPAREDEEVLTWPGVLDRARQISKVGATYPTGHYEQVLQFD